jgi:hypothetical protein
VIVGFREDRLERLVGGGSESTGRKTCPRRDPHRTLFVKHTRNGGQQTGYERR